MCSTVPPKAGNSYQLPMQQTARNPNQIYSTSESLFDAGNPNNFQASPSAPTNQGSTPTPPPTTDGAARLGRWGRRRYGGGISGGVPRFTINS